MSWRTRRTSSNAGWEPLELFFRDEPGHRRRDPGHWRRGRRHQALRATLAPLNRSGGNGTATAEARDGKLTVTVSTNGVSRGLPHAQHVHIGGRSECPSSDAGNASEPRDLISTAEGQPTYGPVKVSLTTEGPRW
jgi:hypothetical protein